MNDLQRIILWSGVIVLGIGLLMFGPRPQLLAPTPPSGEVQTGSVSATATSTVTVPLLPDAPKKARYIEVIDGCGPYYSGECLNVRTGPGTDYPVVHTLRTGAVLEYDGTTLRDGRTWYHIVFNEWLRYPERVDGERYVSAEYVRAFEHEGATELPAGWSGSTNKRIIVDRSDQMLYAYEGEDLYMQESISTGVELTPTPRGTFTVFRKTPTRYMQGPIIGISDKFYDLPGVPWNLYFTAEGAVIHGAYWHDKFGRQWSNGCVNLPPERAKQLYEWAELGTTVIVRD